MEFSKNVIGKEFSKERYKFSSNDVTLNRELNLDTDVRDYILGFLQIDRNRYFHRIGNIFDTKQLKNQRLQIR